MVEKRPFESVKTNTLFLAEFEIDRQVVDPRAQTNPDAASVAQVKPTRL